MNELPIALPMPRHAAFEVALRHVVTALLSTLLAALTIPVFAEGTLIPDDPRLFQLRDVFNLEWASEPRLSPDGTRLVYVRNFMDPMHDRRRSNLWTFDLENGGHRPLTTGSANDSQPQLSPDGSRLAYVARDPTAGEQGGAEIFVRWLDRGTTARLTQLPNSPGGLAWSPDGRSLAFVMTVEERQKPFVTLPAKPEGAKWAEPAKVIDRLVYRADGRGDLPYGFSQIFVVSAEGGTPRKLTSDPFHHGASGPFQANSPVWTPDGSALIFSANRRDDWKLEPLDSEIWELRLEDGTLRPLTARYGPDAEPAVSPDGRWIAYVGFDDRHQGHQLRRLYVVERGAAGDEPATPRLLNTGLDRTVAAPRWSADGHGIYFHYDDHGNGKIGYTSFDPAGSAEAAAGLEVEVVAHDVGGLSLGRPYGSGQFDLRADGTVVFTQGGPHRLADLSTVRRGAEALRQVRLNDDLLAHKELGEVEEIIFESSHDGQSIQGWIVYPPGFDPERRYPLLLEIHGGPFANYGDRFAAEIQLYAAAGYVVLYINPRGSTSYGEDFASSIHHAYPGHDYDDLMSGVDAVVARGYIDPERLYITGGSGGGVLTAWAVGHTDRFAAAVVAKPVIHWASFVLTADNANFFHRYWFPALPWEEPMHYWQRSPLSKVGNVTTPTMLLTGEEDFRTPMSESEQYYQALQIQGVDSMLVRIPGAGHGIANRPSQLMSKVAHILAWFARY